MACEQCDRVMFGFQQFRFSPFVVCFSCLYDSATPFAYMIIIYFYNHFSFSVLQQINCISLRSFGMTHILQLIGHVFAPKFQISKSASLFRHVHNNTGLRIRKILSTFSQFFSFAYKIQFGTSDNCD